GPAGLHPRHGLRARRLPGAGGGAHGGAMAAGLNAQAVTAAEAQALWMQHLAHERRSSPRTLEAYGFASGRYIAFLERHRGESLTARDLAGVSAAEIRAWLAALRQGDHPLSPRSLSQALSAV